MDWRPESGSKTLKLLGKKCRRLSLQYLVEKYFSNKKQNKIKLLRINT